jgi:hypothetical protein
LLQKKSLTERTRAPADVIAQTSAEILMAQSKQDGAHTAKEAGRSLDDNRRETADERRRERGSHPPGQAEQLAELGRQGVKQAADASTHVASAAQRSGSAVAECTQEITAAWARYAEEVMRHTSEASRALLRARTFTEMLEVQAKLLRDNIQAFVDQSVRIAESGSRIATRPLEALRETNLRRPRR